MVVSIGKSGCCRPHSRQNASIPIGLPPLSIGAQLLALRMSLPNFSPQLLTLSLSLLNCTNQNYFIE
jgi:hypothetical protein